MTSTSKTDSGANDAPANGGSFGEHGANPTNVYVAHFPSMWTKHELYEIFCPYGPISEIRVMTKQADMGRNRGIAFVHFQRAESAAAAIANLNWTKPNNSMHSILVKLANKSKNIAVRGPSSDVRLTYYDNDSFEFVSRTKVLVSGFPVTWQRDSLQQVFAQFGRVLDIQFVQVSSIDPSTGMPPTSASATVSFEAAESAVQAVAMLDGSPATADHSHMLSVKYSVISDNELPEELKELLQKIESSTNVYVTRLPNHWSQRELAMVFSPYGEHTECRVTTKQNPGGENRGVGFVHYKDPMSATLAVAKLHESVPGGCYQPISVQFAKVHANLHDHILSKGKAGIIAAGAKAAIVSEASNAASGGAAQIAAKAAAATLAASVSAQLKPRTSGVGPAAAMMAFQAQRVAAAAAAASGRAFGATQMPNFAVPTKPLVTQYSVPATSVTPAALMPSMSQQSLSGGAQFPRVNPTLTAGQMAYNPASAVPQKPYNAAGAYKPSVSPRKSTPAVVQHTPSGSFPRVQPQQNSAFPMAQRGATRGRGRGSFGIRGGGARVPATRSPGFSATSQYGGGPTSSGYAGAAASSGYARASASNDNGYAGDASASAGYTGGLASSGYASVPRGGSGRFGPTPRGAGAGANRYRPY